MPDTRWQHITFTMPLSDLGFYSVSTVTFQQGGGLQSENKKTKSIQNMSIRLPGTMKKLFVHQENLVEIL